MQHFYAYHMICRRVSVVLWVGGVILPKRGLVPISMWRMTEMVGFVAVVDNDVVVASL